MDYDENSMFYGAPPSVFEKAKLLRNNQTKAEIILWARLNRKQLGIKFRRQHPIHYYIADFYCHSMKLVIELDGDYHLNLSQIESDKNRTKDLNALGIKVIRFSDEQVLERTDEVVEKIRNELGLFTPNP